MTTLAQARTGSPQSTPDITPAISIATSTSGHTGAATLKLRRIAVAWELNTTNGHVTANGEYAGRVIESLPGKLYYFQSPEDAKRGDMWGMFDTAHTAADCGAVRAVLDRNPPTPHTTPHTQGENA